MIPTTAEVTSLRADLQIANNLIYNTTEGQIKFGDVTITAGGSGEAEADFWIIGAGERSGVTVWADGSGFGRMGAHINLFQTQAVGPIITHELAHLAFGMFDEFLLGQRHQPFI